MLMTRRQIKDASPLRYPGGKSALTDMLAALMDSIEMRRPRTYVEPYAGGAGAALALLHGGHAQKILINDADPAIHAFWQAAVHHNSCLIDMIHETPVTMREWAKQRAIYREKDASSPLRLGFATFFLNRTNRSGVLNAGVIGGQAQAGTYRIDARFNKQDLIERLSRIGHSADDIQVSNYDGIKVIRKHIQLKRSFIYADPPYFAKGAYLYKNSFTAADHARLAKLLVNKPNGNWLLSYDNVPEIRRLYAALSMQEFDLHYSAHRTGLMRELLIPSARVSKFLTG